MERIKHTVVSLLIVTVIVGLMGVHVASVQAQEPEYVCDVKLITRLLDVIEKDIAPITAQEVKKGNKLFGAAILKKDDLSVVIAESNNEMENPLWHGEVHALKRYWEMPLFNN